MLLGDRVNVFAVPQLAEFIASSCAAEHAFDQTGWKSGRHENFVAISRQSEFQCTCRPSPNNTASSPKSMNCWPSVDRLKAGLAESRTQQERLAATLIESALQAA